MPNRKRKGSFREELDDFLTRFGESEHVQIAREDKKRSPQRRDSKGVHDMLFEEAWRRP